MTWDKEKPRTDRAQFGGLPMGDLVGAPLVAASQANLQLAAGIIEFIKAIGFATNPGAPGLDPLARPVGPGLGDLGPGAPITPPGETEN